MTQTPWTDGPKTPLSRRGTPRAPDWHSDQADHRHTVVRFVLVICVSAALWAVICAGVVRLFV